jgi:ABC-type sugar transport system ATPase subunit
VAGLETPTGGRVEIGGRDVTEAEPNTRHVAMAFENYALYPQETVYDNIAFPLRSKRYYQPPDVARALINQVAGTLGIGHLLERMPRELSGGQRQRVALARVMVRPADVLLLDEPLSHLDAKLRATMRAELKSLGELQHTTSLYVTHDYLEALALGDRIAILRDGELVQVGTRDELWRAPVNTFVATAFGQPRLNLLRGVTAEEQGKSVFTTEDGLVRIPLGRRDVAPGTAVELGLRPRDLLLGEAPGMAILRGQVYVVEPLGRQREVTVQIGEQRVAVVTPHEDVALDSLVSISAPHDRLLLFNAETGDRIPAASGQASGVAAAGVTADG